MNGEYKMQNSSEALCIKIAPDILSHLTTYFNTLEENINYQISCSNLDKKDVKFVTNISDYVPLVAANSLAKIRSNGGRAISYTQFGRLILDGIVRHKENIINIKLSLDSSSSREIVQTLRAADLGPSDLRSYCQLRFVETENAATMDKLEKMIIGQLASISLPFSCDDLVLRQVFEDNNGLVRAITTVPDVKYRVRGQFGIWYKSTEAECIETHLKHLQQHCQSQVCCRDSKGSILPFPVQMERIRGDQDFVVLQNFSLMGEMSSMNLQLQYQEQTGKTGGGDPNMFSFNRTPKTVKTREGQNWTRIITSNKTSITRIDEILRKPDKSTTRRNFSKDMEAAAETGVSSVRDWTITKFPDSNLMATHTDTGSKSNTGTEMPAPFSSDNMPISTSERRTSVRFDSVPIINTPPGRGGHNRFVTSTALREGSSPILSRRSSALEPDIIVVNTDGPQSPALTSNSRPVVSEPGTNSGASSLTSGGQNEAQEEENDNNNDSQGQGQADLESFLSTLSTADWDDLTSRVMGRFTDMDQMLEYLTRNEQNHMQRQRRVNELSQAMRSMEEREREVMREIEQQPPQQQQQQQQIPVENDNAERGANNDIFNATF